MTGKRCKARKGRVQAVQQALRLRNGQRVDGDPDVEPVVVGEGTDIDRAAEPRPKRVALLDGGTADVVRATTSRDGRSGEIDGLRLRMKGGD